MTRVCSNGDCGRPAHPNEDECGACLLARIFSPALHAERGGRPALAAVVDLAGFDRHEIHPSPLPQEGTPVP